MKLSARIIMNHLKKEYPAGDLSRFSVSLDLARPVFPEDTGSWPRGRVCICAVIPPSLAEAPVPPNSLVLLCPPGKGRSSAKLPVHSDKVFEMPAGTDPEAVFNRLQILYDTYEKWDSTLLELVRNEESIQSLLDASFPIFRNPLLFRTADFRMAACSSIIEELPELRSLIDPVSSFETLTTSQMEPVYSEAARRTEPFFLPEYLSGVRELCANLFTHRIFSHRLTIPESLEPLDDFHLPLIAHLAGYLQMALSYTDIDNAGETYPLEDLLRDIISRKVTDQTRIDNNLAEYGWYPSHSYCCLNLKMASLAQQNLTSQYLCRNLEEIITGSCAFRYENELVIFVNLTRFDGTIDQLLNDSIVFLRDSFLKTGVSNAAESTADLAYCYQQARIALETGSRYQPYLWVHKFDDVSLTYMTECCTRELPTHMICSQKLLKLKAHDEEHHSEYYETLKTYLNTHLNAVQASKKLFIHRSTFLYRIERIRELINIDFDNEDMLFYLMISFRILSL